MSAITKSRFALCAVLAASTLAVGCGADVGSKEPAVEDFTALRGFGERVRSPRQE